MFVGKMFTTPVSSEDQHGKSMFVLYIQIDTT